MVKKRKESLGENVSPQLIMWRPINYFSVSINEDEDNFDKFKFIGYLEKNTTFDIRKYEGHPSETVTLYLPSVIDEEDVIQEQINTAIEILSVPQDALAWRRGEEIKYGELKRKPRDRLRESEARNIVLKILSTCPAFEAKTKKIKDLVPSFYALSDDDKAMSKTRNGESVWRQIIGNVKVHKDNKNSIFSQGFAKEIPDGIALTPKGFDYLKSIGFVD